MKILLFGEFSGLHTNLKFGLEQLGHKVTLVSSGDSFKKFNGDINVSTSYKNIFLRRIILLFKYLWYFPRFIGYDVVQYIQPYVFFTKPRFAYWYLLYLKAFNKKIFYNVCGGDAIVNTNALTMRYSPLLNEIKEGVIERGSAYSHLGLEKYITLQKIVKQYDGIIASSYSYFNAYQKYNNLKGFIPMPIKPEKVPEICMVQSKIAILHGIIRAESKGSFYILEALKKIELKYADKVEIIIVEKLPFIEYVKKFDKCHILIDQCVSYGYGMNALLGLSKGKVVMSGCEKEMQELLSTPCPIINILPDANDIYNKIEELVLQKDKIHRIAKQGYEFVNLHHDCNSIARAYLTKWL